MISQQLTKLKKDEQPIKICHINNYDIFILLAMKSINGVIKYYHPDHLGVRL